MPEQLVGKVQSVIGPVVDFVRTAARDPDVPD